MIDLWLQPRLHRVHYATLVDGSDLIVKVQRPGIREQLETDINIITVVANLLDKYLPESRSFNSTGIVEEFSKTVKKELDFIEEARNYCRFRRNFEQSLDVYIPKMCEEFVTEKVLVMERIEGVRIDNTSRLWTLIEENLQA